MTLGQSEVVRSWNGSYKNKYNIINMVTKSHKIAGLQENVGTMGLHDLLDLV